jgi:hypothetical protein
LFKENCSECHSTWPHRWSEPEREDKRFIENAIVMTDVIGTDPGQFFSPQFQSRPTAMPGPMSPHLAAPFTGATLAPAASRVRPDTTRPLRLGIGETRS